MCKIAHDISTIGPLGIALLAVTPPSCRIGSLLVQTTPCLQMPSRRFLQECRLSFSLSCIPATTSFSIGIHHPLPSSKSCPSLHQTRKTNKGIKKLLLLSLEATKSRAFSLTLFSHEVTFSHALPLSFILGPHHSRNHHHRSSNNNNNNDKSQRKAEFSIDPTGEHRKYRKLEKSRDPGSKW